MGNAVAVRDIGGRSIAGHDSQAMRRVGLVRPSANPAEIMSAHKDIASMVAEVLEPGIDYGEIPGTDGKKSLLKAGAERLAFSIGASIELEVIEKEIDHMLEVPWKKVKKVWSGPKGARRSTETEQTGFSLGLYRYVVKARLVRREDGAVLGEGIGSCSTMESKYVDRPRDSENTVLKMAKKRAAVDAVLSTMALTGRFSPEEGADDEDGADDDGVVKDPSDGLTLDEALKHQVNKVALGSMSPRALASARTWCDGKLGEDPDSAALLRLSEMINMVRTHRETNPLVKAEAPKADAVATEAKAETTSPAEAAASDDDDLPF